MFWVKAKGKTINLATANEIGVARVDEHEETHYVFSLWFGNPDDMFVLFSGSEEDCEKFKKRLDSMMDVTPLDNLLSGRSFTD